MKQLDRKYFAYGSNMDPRQMECRCPGSVPLGIYRLIGYRFIINNCGVATIVPDENGEVVGIVWSINEEHELTLDKKEGVAKGTYFKETVRVWAETGVEVEALVYIASESEPGSPREGYLEKILFGAHHFELPEEYISELESWVG